MIPVEFPEKNFTFQKPSGMTDKQCSSLNVWKGNDTVGTPLIYSRLEFNKEELDALKEGKLTGVWLCIMGCGMPPVLVQTEYPFVKEPA